MLAVLLALAPPAALAQSTPAGNDSNSDTRDCALLWQVTPQLQARPAHLRVSLRFEAGQRSSTMLHLPAGWDGLQAMAQADGDAPALIDRMQAVPGQPAMRLVQHAPGAQVQLHWRLVPPGDAAQGGSIQLAPRWFAFSGLGLLPIPDGVDEPAAGRSCIVLAGLPDQSRWASSHGTAEGARVVFRPAAGAAPLAQRVQHSLYAGGALQWRLQPGLAAVLPDADGDTRAWPWTAERLASVGGHALANARQQWADTAAAPPWLLLLLPTTTAAADGAMPASGGLGSAWHQALALQTPAGQPADDALLERLLTQALARAWMADRIGPLAHAGRGDAALRAWFSDGWAEFLAHRSLLRQGLWTADDYAAALNTRIAAYLNEPARALPNAQVAAASAGQPRLAELQTARGEWLALHWHQALRRAGQPGLDAVLRRLQMAPAQARREGPISEPLATHRVMAALRTVLHDQPLRELQQHIDQGQPFAFGPDTLGPCFSLQRPAPADLAAPPRYQPVAQALQQADCRGWLMSEPGTDAAAPVPRAGTRAAAKPAGKAAKKPGTRAGQPAKATKSTKAATATKPAKATKPAARGRH